MDDDRDAIAELLGLLEIVRRQQDRVAVLLHAKDLEMQLTPRLWIKTSGGLVEQNEFGPIDERQGEGEALPLATGKRRETGVGFFDQGEPLQERFRSARRGKTPRTSAALPVG